MSKKPLISFGFGIAVVGVLVAGCGKQGRPSGDVATPPASVNVDGPADRQTTSLKTAGAVDFPVLPSIEVPDILGTSPAQAALETSMASFIDPVAGISVRPARCATDGALINHAGITEIDEAGNVARNSADGIFEVGTDGSGTANFQGGIVQVNADGSGTINGRVDSEGNSAVVEINADGSGSYNGVQGIIELDGKGGGSWNGGKVGLLSIAGDGSGTWNGSKGIIEIRADGSGTWNGPEGDVVNNGDGSGTVNGKPVKMAPLPPVAKAGKFPPLKKLNAGAPCGYLVVLNDAVLFDFDKATLRPDAANLITTLGHALSKAPGKSIEVRGHTDSKGSDDYNLDLSNRRAEAVLAALREITALQVADSKGYGESQPVAPNEINGKDNPSGRQQNRRVEIFVRS